MLLGSHVVYMYKCLPPGWCRTSGAGPAAPPPPAMTSPARTSTWISRKPRSAARQGLEAAMCRRTAARLWNSPRLESRPVAVQCAQTNRVTALPLPVSAAGPGTGLPAAADPGTDAITATAASNSLSVQTKDIIACRARWTGKHHSHERRVFYTPAFGVRPGTCKKIGFKATTHAQLSSSLCSRRSLNANEEDRPT